MQNATTIDEYTKEDLALFDFELSDAEMTQIDAMKK
jgi:diketogulonate reductase-like aldo/keto reductase